MKEFGVRHNIWEINNAYGSSQSNKAAYEHPALMPQSLAGDLIKSYSYEGDLVLDPFMGSGTTAEACISLDRNYIGFEKNKIYYDMSQKRLENLKIKRR